jgi:molybdopterin-guanine dinucleotide biosynthesis protein A
MYKNITGIVLSGGRSSRMGENKSLLKIGNKTIIEYVLDLMGSLFGKVIIITNDFDEYSFLDVPKFKDIFPRMGPLAGIHSGLVNSVTHKNFILSCDMPMMTAQMIEYIINFNTDKPITVAKAGGYIQQLCGLYDKSCIGYAEDILKTELNNEGREADQKKRGCRVLNLLHKTEAEIIDAETLPFYSPDMYFNMNKREDYRFALNKLIENPIH